ncbi:hypothetical protein CC80DRAFT_78717 [Byssothecium circinans]|uniref:Uncharacterized protein n=1 Tax=Byssothecium circinans TaxID=147558 RepID=A0A6A5TSZ3_9PLEO|nr:hypothetical protein CC80DRAFT_78717 [Byssothecium circinans]
MASTPTVIYPLTLPALLNYILTTQSDTARTTLIVCSSRDTFLHNLQHGLQHPSEQHGEDAQHLISRLITPTLQNLATARYVKVTFCASVPALLAYLTAYESVGPKRGGSRRATGTGKIVLVNPLSLHAPSPSFSVQGLSKTFAAAVDMAARADALLILAECQRLGHVNEVEDVDMERGEGESRDVDVEVDPWEQEVSILNVSAKKFGSGNSDRAWAGRTVKIKRVAARWFHFHKLSVPEGEAPG